MPTQTIPLSHLHSHPDNSNEMPERLLAKLVDHIANTGRYPPLIVRPIEPPACDIRENQDEQHYQILDGHHRLLALKRIGHNTAECVVWQANDQEAALLLATLNRLQGQDNPRKRGRLMAHLAERYDAGALVKMLPERIEQIRKLIEVSAPPLAPRAPQRVEEMPVAVHFFLLPDQKQALNASLRKIGGTREEALMKLVHTCPE